MTTDTDTAPGVGLTALMPRNDLWTIDGWQRYVDRHDAQIEVEALSRAQYDALTRIERRKFDFQRKTLAANLPKFETPMAAPVRDQINATILRNTLNDDPGPREGIFLSANPGLGKSTLVREIAAEFDQDVRGLAELMPNRYGYLDRWVPVVWISVPSKVSIISLCRRILYFFGYPMPKGSRQAELEEKVLTLIRACGVELIVLDDITRMNMTRDRDKEVADYLRHLMESSVTILGVGVDIETSGLAMLTERAPSESRAALKQNRSRFSLHHLDKFSYDTKEEIADWVAHLMALEQALPLLDGTDGVLSGDLSEILYQRSDGVIGTLHSLVSKACMAAIGRPADRGGEVITASDITAVVLDIAAEESYRATLAETPAPRPKRASSPRRTSNGAYDGRPRRSA